MEMNKKTLRFQTGAASQRGFTFVELAIVLVIAGIILIGALKGTDMINKAKIERVISDLQGIQGMVLEHEKRTGRLAGDCDADGTIGVTDTSIKVKRLAGSVWDDKIDPTDGTGPACKSYSPDEEKDLNTPWKDLRKANIVDPSRLNRLLAKNQTDNFYAIGSWEINSVPTNLIVAYGIPLWMAKGIDVAIDGPSGGDYGKSGGSTGRVRMFHDGTNVSASGTDFPTNDAEDDRVVAIYFQFDRAAPTEPAVAAAP